MVKFENGYSVETVFDGSKLGIEPYSLEVLPNGELLILDSENSNIYKISSSLSLYSRPRLVTGSPEGYAGHVDGRLRDARLNHPKGLTVDDRGNIYVADTVNNAIRKISEGGVTTIPGGKTARNGGHVDGPSEEAKFSNDFDVVYVGSSCSLLVIDRGNRAIREIQLHFDDCAYQYGVKSRNVRSGSSDQKPMKPSRPSLIPNGDEQQEKQDESFLVSIGNLASNAWVSVMEILKRKQSPQTFSSTMERQSSLLHLARQLHGRFKKAL
ncbi:hypothetical protein Bca101_042018 [Brassica carinata]